MKWYSEHWVTRMQRQERWHTWFAWHPVRIGDYIVWLEYVERRLCLHYVDFWEYRDIAP